MTTSAKELAPVQQKQTSWWADDCTSQEQHAWLRITFLWYPHSTLRGFCELSQFTELSKGPLCYPIHLSFLSSLTNASAVLHQPPLCTTLISVEILPRKIKLVHCPLLHSPTPRCKFAQSPNFHLRFCQVNGFPIDSIDGHFFLATFLFLLEFQKCT